MHKKNYIKVYEVMFAVFLCAVRSCVIADIVYRVNRRKNYPKIENIGKIITTSTQWAMALLFVYAKHFAAV
jgi:hypothetical protein